MALKLLHRADWTGFRPVLAAPAFPVESELSGLWFDAPGPELLRCGWPELEARAAGRFSLRLPELLLPFGEGRPADLPALRRASAGCPADGFALRAVARPRLAAGTWQLAVAVFDEPLRVFLDGEPAPRQPPGTTEHRVPLRLEAEREVELVVETLELRGWALLMARLERM